MLSNIHNQFTEGYDTPDLKEAKALLDELKVAPKAASKQGSNYLADPPEEGQRSLGDPREVLGPGKVAKIRAEWSAEHLV